MSKLRTQALNAQSAIGAVLVTLSQPECEVKLDHKDRLHLRNAENILARLRDGKGNSK